MSKLLHDRQLPQIVEYRVSIVETGAVGDGKTKNTRAIQQALDACADRGGGCVVIPPGIWLTGALTLRSKVELHAQEGALVLFSRDFDDYPLLQASYEGVSTVRCQAPLQGDDLHDVAITGEGIFDGSGDAWRPVKKSKLTPSQWEALCQTGGCIEKTEEESIWWPTKEAMLGETVVAELHDKPSFSIEEFEPARDFLRPTLLRLQRCQKVLLQGPTFENSPAWCLHLFQCDQVTIRQVNVRNPWYAQNGDGIDLDSCTNVLLEDSAFDVGDDAICIKSGKRQREMDRHLPSADMLIRRCTVYHGHGGFVVGSEMSGGVKNLHVQDCTFIGTDVGIRFKSARGRGGVIENILIERIQMVNIAKEAISFHMFYDGTEGTFFTEEERNKRFVDEGTPYVRHIRLREITCIGAKTAILINELVEAPIEDLHIEKTHIVAEHGIIMQGGAGVHFHQNQIVIENKKD